MDFGQLQPGAHIRGLDTGGIAEIIQVRSFGPDALNLVFRVNGKIGERLLYRGDEIPFELVQPGRAYAFDADGEDGSAQDGGPAPYLDTRPATEAERAALSDIAQASWLSGQVEERAITYAIAHLVPAHLQEVRTRRLPEINKIEHEVRARLTREINYWDARAARLREEERAGKDQRINASNAEATAQRLTDRLYKRQTELDRERQISPLSPVLRGAALIIPRGLLEQRTALPVTPMAFSEDPIARAEIERHAMQAVIAAERALGNDPHDVSAEKKGWDIESRDGATGHLRFIEVKGRHADGSNRMIGRSANALASSIVLVCRSRPETSETVTRSDFLRTLRRELPAGRLKVRAEKKSGSCQTSHLMACVTHGRHGTTAFTRTSCAFSMMAAGVRLPWSLVTPS